MSDLSINDSLDTTSYSYAPKDPLSYCNKFNKKGFNGTIVANYNWDKNTFDTNKAQLYLWDVPYEFTYPPTNYIQLHSFYIANNKTVFKKKPVSIEIIKDSSDESISLITTIGHDLLEDMGLSIKELILNYSFLLEDMRGWQGIALSVFNAQNKPVKTVQILVPPFESNPHTYMDNHNKEKLLFQLHPFETISHHNTTDRFFYEKGVDFCKSVPLPFDIPPFETYSIGKDPVDQLIDDLSLLPDFQ